MKAYKLFRIKNGNLYPLYVFANEPTKMHVWVRAKCGDKDENGKVKSKLGALAYRPGWHLTEFPLANHIGKRAEDGTLLQAKDTVWCEVEMSDQINYTPQVLVTKKNGEVNYPKSYMKELPTHGYYEYKTNPLAACRWFIADAIKVNKILTNEEVADICRANGLEPQKVEVA